MIIHGTDREATVILINSGTETGNPAHIDFYNAKVTFPESTVSITLAYLNL